MLGNHGLLIDCGNEVTAELKTVPTLFHAGYTPAALLLTSPRVRDGGGAAVLQRMWPQLPVIRTADLPAEGLVLETQAGCFTIYPDTRSHTSGQSPVIVWESAAGRVIYVGNASYAACQPFMEAKADVVVLGEHSRQPVQAGDIEASRVILLPGVHEAAAMADEAHLQLVLPLDTKIPGKELPRDSE